jgi:hypothetical protein
MKLVIACIAACLPAAACAGPNAQSDSMVGYEANARLGGHGQLEGAAVQSMIGEAGGYLEMEASLHDADRRDDARIYKSFSLGMSNRISLFGVLAPDHDLERYLDLGAAAGADFSFMVGVPPHGGDGVFSAWAGAWVDIGTISARGGYLAVTGSVRREAYTDPWNDRTQVMIGLAWRQRRPIAQSVMRSL